MRKYYITFLVVCLVAVTWSLTEIAPKDKAGARVDPGALHTERAIWTVIDTTSSTGTEPTDLAVTERTYQTAKTAQGVGASGDDEISFFDIPRGWNGIRLRAQGITDDGTATYQVYAGTLGDGNRDADSTTADCELAYIGQFAFTIGTQASITSTYEMADTLVVTESDWTVDMTVTGIVKSPTGNRLAEGRLDLLGADVLVLVPTVVTADCKLLARGF